MNAEELRKLVRDYADKNSPGWRAVYFGIEVNGEEVAVLILPQREEEQPMKTKRVLRIHG